jgi:hypothetical protein
MAPDWPRAAHDCPRTSRDFHRTDIDRFLVARGSSLTSRRRDLMAHDRDRVPARSELTAAHLARSEPDRSPSSPHGRICCFAASPHRADTSSVCPASSRARTGMFSRGPSALSAAPATLSGPPATLSGPPATLRALRTAVRRCSARPPGRVRLSHRRCRLLACRCGCVADRYSSDGRRQRSVRHTRAGTSVMKTGARHWGAPMFEK